MGKEDVDPKLEREKEGLSRLAGEGNFPSLSQGWLPLKKEISSLHCSKGCCGRCFLPQPNVLPIRVFIYLDH